MRVEIQRIDPPQDVVAAMHNQMRAERSRRAVVTEASGEREAAITRAEGKKEAAILAAEGDKRAAILEAEGVRQTKILEADGEAEAVRKVFAAIHEGRPTNDLLALKYLQALPAIADGQATKIFLPTEATALLGTLGGMAELLQTAPKPNTNGAPVRRDPQVSPPST